MGNDTKNLETSEKKKRQVTGVPVCRGKMFSSHNHKFNSPLLVCELTSEASNSEKFGVFAKFLGT